MTREKKPFNDLWIRIIGIPAIGISFPFIFGLRLGSPYLFTWLFISTFTTLVTWLFTRQITSLIWKTFPWERNPFLHIVMNLLLVILFSMLTLVMIFILNVVFLNREPSYWHEMGPIRTGVFLIVAFLNLLHEAIHLFYKWKGELTRAADLEKENIRSRYEALKNHVNPHFLFNSLGTLASLIRTNPVQAEQYVNSFASIYRYFLEVGNNDLVTLKEELDFIDSYLFLQQIRFGSGFVYQNQIRQEQNELYLLPLTLELLIENAFKHNTTMNSSPLLIEVGVNGSGSLLEVRNTYQPRVLEQTTGTGLKNLEQRYMSYLNLPIWYGLKGDKYVVEIPLIAR